MASVTTAEPKPRGIHCKWCDRSFNKGEHLRRHERSHTGAKPFVCKVCKRSFNRQDSLVRHAKLHTRESSQYPSPESIDTEQSISTITGEVNSTISNTAIPDTTNIDTSLADLNPINFNLDGTSVTDDQDFGLIWPDSENLFQSIVSFDNQWQIPLGTLSYDEPHVDIETPATSSSFEGRVSSIEAIPTGANHQAVHNVSKMITNLSSSVTAAVEATSINSVFLDECLHMFFVKFIPTFPILHRATFVFRECTPPLLLNAIAIGSLYLGPKDAVAKGEALWSLAHTAISTSWDTLITHRGIYDACDGVQLVVTALLAQLYGALSRNRAIRTSSQALRTMGLFWARQCGMFDSLSYVPSQQLTLDCPEHEKQYQWRMWVAREIQQRALLAHYMLDGIISQMSGSASSARHTANSLCLPSMENVFDASNATDWLILMQSQSSIRSSFRSIFRNLFAVVDEGWLDEMNSSAFAYKVVLEGLHGLAAECREGEEAIGLPSAVEVQRALARSYESISRNGKLLFAEKHEVLLRWHSICLESIVDTSSLCIGLCGQHNVEQALWKNYKQMNIITNLLQWPGSIDARRALLHAVAIQEIVEQLPRGRAHAIHMPSALFSASIVYAVFILAGLTSVRLPATVNWLDALSDDCQLPATTGAAHLSTSSLETRKYLRGEPLFGTTAVARNLLYELNSMQKLFRCLCAQWGIAYDMADVVDQMITLCH